MEEKNVVIKEVVDEVQEVEETKEEKEGFFQKPVVKKAGKILLCVGVGAIALIGTLLAIGHSAEEEYHGIPGTTEDSIANLGLFDDDDEDKKKED